jgi:hypothetical protein
MDVQARIESLKIPRVVARHGRGTNSCSAVAWPYLAGWVVFRTLPSLRRSSLASISHLSCSFLHARRCHGLCNAQLTGAAPFAIPLPSSCPIQSCMSTIVDRRTQNYGRHAAIQSVQSMHPSVSHRPSIPRLTFAFHGEKENSKWIPAGNRVQRRHAICSTPQSSRAQTINVPEEAAHRWACSKKHESPGP